MKYLKRAVALLLTAALALSFAACGETGGGETPPPPTPPVPPVTYDTVSFTETHSLTFFTYSAVTEEDLVRGMNAKNQNKVKLQVSLSDRSELNLFAAGTYRVTVGAKMPQGEWVKKNAEEIWKATRTVTVTDLAAEGIEATGFDQPLVLDVGEMPTAADVLEGLSVVKDGVSFGVTVDESQLTAIDPYAIGNSYDIAVGVLDANGVAIRTGEDQALTFTRTVMVTEERLYYIEVASNNGDRGPWGTGESSTVDADTAEKLGANGLRLPVKASNCYETDMDISFPVQKADPLGAILVRNMGEANITVNAAGSLGVAATILPDGAVSYMADSVNGKIMSASRPDTSVTPPRTLTSYGMNYVLAPGEIGLFLSDYPVQGENELTAEESGCLFVAKNIGALYRNYVRVYQGNGADLSYETSTNCWTAYGTNAKAPRLYGTGENAVVDIARLEEGVMPTLDEVKELILAGVSAYLNDGTWNGWEKVTLSAALLDDGAREVDGAFTGGAYGAAKEFANYQFTAAVNGEPLFTRMLEVMSSEPFVPTVDFVKKTGAKPYEFRYVWERGLVPSNQTIGAAAKGKEVVIDPTVPFRNGGIVGAVRDAIISYQFLYNEDGTRSDNAFTQPSTGLAANNFAFIVDGNGVIRVAYSPMADGWVSILKADGSLGHATYAATSITGLFTGDYAIDKMLAQYPGGFMVISPNTAALRDQLKQKDGYGWATSALLDGLVGATFVPWCMEIPGFNPGQAARG